MVSCDKATDRLALFQSVFGESDCDNRLESPAPLPCTHNRFSCSNSKKMAPIVCLVRKLIAVLDTIERLPVQSHDSPGSALNLQVTAYVVTHINPRKGHILGNLPLFVFFPFG